MRNLVVGILLLLAVTPAAATVHWSGIGWYQIEEDDSGPLMAPYILVSGPFATESECKATLPADTSEVSFYCQYFSKNPPNGS